MSLERLDDRGPRGTREQQRFTFAVYRFAISILNTISQYILKLYNNLAI